VQARANYIRGLADPDAEVQSGTAYFSPYSARMRCSIVLRGKEMANPALHFIEGLLLVLLWQTILTPFVFSRQRIWSTI
jgi:hypothetical protein